MNERHICGTCACHKYDVDGEDFVCVNDRSDNFAAWTGYNDTCEEWQEKESGRRRK